MTLERSDPGSVYDVEQLVTDTPLSGGARNDLGPRHIARNEAVELQNADVEFPSVIKKRSGYVQSELSNEAFTNEAFRPSCLFDFDVGPGSRFLVTALRGQSGGVYAAVDPDSVDPWGALTVGSAPTGMAVGHQIDPATDSMPIFQGNGLCWMLPGGGNVHAIEPSGNIIDCGNETNSPVRGAVDGCWLLSRVWLLKDDGMYYSKLLPEKGDLVPTPSAFIKTDAGSGASGGVIRLSPKRPGRAVAAVPWRDSSIIVFYRDRIYELQIDSSNPINSTLNLLEDNIGCASRRAILAFGDEVVFLDNYLNIRSLRETITGQTRGVAITEPLNERIHEEFPGRLNETFTDRVQIRLDGRRMVVAYPRDTSEECNAAVYMDMGTRVFEIMPALYAHSFADLLSSDIRGGRPELFATNATGNFALYRFDQNAKSDAGEAIELKVTLRAEDFGETWSKKRPTHGRVDFRGEVGSVLNVYARTKLNDAFSLIKAATVVANSDADFPLVDPDDFPLADPADFPLIDATPQPFSEPFPIPPRTGYEDLPLGNETWPAANNDLPFTAKFGVDEGPVVQIQFQESSTKALNIDSYQFATIVKNAELMA